MPIAPTKFIAQILDATATGQALVTAANAGAARTTLWLDSNDAVTFGSVNGLTITGPTNQTTTLNIGNGSTFETTGNVYFGGAVNLAVGMEALGSVFFSALGFEATAYTYFGGTFQTSGAISLFGGGTINMGGYTLTVPATGTAALLGTANTFTAAQIVSAAGAASTPALKLSGVPFAGTGTTSFPLFYINDSNATASTTLNTAGTYFGINGDGTQDLMNLLKDGASMFSVSSGGNVAVNGSLTMSTANLITWATRGSFYAVSVNGFYLRPISGNDCSLFFGVNTSSGARISNVGTALTAGLGDGTAGGSFTASGTLTVGGYIAGAEMTAPAAPAANGFRIYAEDNGAGKTRLMVLFASGAAQQIAIEP